MELLTIQETAKQLKLPTATVRRYIATGRLPAVQIGRHIRVRQDALEQSLKPVRPVHRRKPHYRRAGVFTKDDPLWSIVGIAGSDEGKDTRRGAEDADKHAGVFTKDDSLWGIVGMFASEEPEDIAVNKDRYLAEAYMPRSE